MRGGIEEAGMGGKDVGLRPGCDGATLEDDGFGIEGAVWGKRFNASIALIRGRDVALGVGPVIGAKDVRTDGATASERGVLSSVG